MRHGHVIRGGEGEKEVAGAVAAGGAAAADAQCGAAGEVAQRQGGKGDVGAENDDDRAGLALLEAPLWH